MDLPRLDLGNGASEAVSVCGWKYMCVCWRGKVSGFLLALRDSPLYSDVPILSSQRNAGKQR